MENIITPMFGSTFLTAIAGIFALVVVAAIVSCVKIIKEQELLLDNKGRIIVRESGTEPIIRVMVESKEEAMINNICEKIVSSIEKSFQKKN